jgi:general secretion pathway protein H
MALMMGVVPFAYSRWTQYLDFKNTLRDVTHELRSAREQALSTNKAAHFSVDVRNRTFRAQSGKERKLPSGLDFVATTAAAASADDKVKNIVFYPDGGSTGGSLRLTSGARSVTIKVDWLTSKFEVDTPKLRP